MSNILRIRTLTDRFFDGNTTLDEEQELYDYYSREPSLPPDLQPLRQMFLDLAAVRYVAIPSQRPLQPKRQRWPRWLAAAAVALLIATVGAVLMNSLQQDDECVAYIYGERTTDRDVVLGEMQKTMAVLADDGSNVVEEQLRMMFRNE
jgi:hypothetical protein